MKAALLVLPLALGLAACGGDAEEADTSGLNTAGEGDRAAPAPGRITASDYASAASATDRFEIESARLVAERAQDDEVRHLADMISADHQKSRDDLGIAAQEARPPITVFPEMNAEQQANLHDLGAAGHEAFDRLYLEQQVEAHQKALALVRAYARTGDVEALRKHALSVAGLMERHLARARELRASRP